MEKSGFFNAMKVGDTWDRVYKAENFAEYFATFISNGVFPNPSTNLQVMGNNNNMTVIIKSGKAWINGFIYINTDDLILPIDVADGTLNRIDKVVLRYDVVKREIRAAVKKGAFASTPVSLTLQRDADAYELGIADIYVKAGAISITQADITDLRLNNDLCGIVHGTVDQADTTTIFNQYLDWYNTKTSQYQIDMSNMKQQFQTDMNVSKQQFQSDFNIWFNSIKNTLNGDTAGNLLNMINAIPKIVEGKTEPTTGTKAGDFWFKEVT